MSLDKVLHGLTGGGGGSGKLEKQSAANMKKAGENFDAASDIYKSLAPRGANEIQNYFRYYQPSEHLATATAKRGLTPRLLGRGLYQRGADYEGITDMRGAASEDVGHQFDVGRATLTRDLARYGITPDSGAGTSALQSDALAEAAARAGAMTRAGVDEATAQREERRYAEAQDFNRKSYLDAENERRRQAAEAETFRRRDLVGQQGRGVFHDGTQLITGAANGLTSVGNGYAGNAGQLANQAASVGGAEGSGLGDLIKAGIQIYGASQGAPVA